MFFGSLARNLEKDMLSQGKGQTGYNKLIEDLKVLYPQCWPQDGDALFGESEVKTLRSSFVLIARRMSSGHSGNTMIIMGHPFQINLMNSWLRSTLSPSQVLSVRGAFPR